MSGSGGMGTERRAGPPPGREGSNEFAEWVRPSLPYLRRLAVLSAPGHDPDDVVQDALLRAWLRWETYRSERGSATSWLLAITADQARRTRRRHRKLLFLADLETFGQQIPVTPSDDSSALIDLRGAVAKLSTRQREAVTLYYYVGLGIADVSVLMNCAEGTVKSTLADARHRLGLLLGEAQ